MAVSPELHRVERVGLVVLAVAAFLVLNGLFLYGLVVRRGSLAATLANPIGLAFVIESMVLLVVLPWLLARWRIVRIHWAWFIVLACLGGLIFALPVVLLAGRDRTPPA